MKKRLSKRNLIRAGIMILMALVLAVVLEWVTQRTLPPIFLDAEVDVSQDPTIMKRGSTYLHASGRTALKEEWNLRRLAVIFLIQLGVMGLIFPLGLGRRLLAWAQETGNHLKRVITEEKGKNWKLMACFLLTFGAAFLLGRVWIRETYDRDNWMTLAVCGWLGAAAGCLTTFRRTLARKPEAFFLILTLILGGMLCFFLPDATQVSLDDGQHYQHALNYSMLGRVRFTGADWDAMQMDNPRNYDLTKWDSWLAAQDAKYAEGAVYVTSGCHLSLKEYWLAFHGLGLFLGRLLHLRFWDLWSVGRFTGLMAYAMIGYFAIRRLKSGKMILALYLMIPTNLFLASNYSYDPGVTAGITLACAYWIAQWQERDQRLKNRDVVLMVVPMLFACYAKAIYFPIFLLFLFLPRTKFRDRQHRRRYFAVMLLAILAVMLYILLPMGRSGGQGDSRAEGDVNTFGQMQFILQNPLTYAGYLWRFLQNYLDPNQARMWVNSFGYQGWGNTTNLVLILLAIAVFTDAREEGMLPGPGVRACGEVILFASLALMVTSMYVWMSAVGSDLFNGVQPRYLLPYVYPALALLGSNSIRNRINPAVYHGLLFAGMSLAVTSGILDTCVAYYH